MKRQNLKYQIIMVSAVIALTGVAMIPSVIAALCYGEKAAALALGTAAVICVSSGSFVCLRKGKRLRPVMAGTWYMTLLSAWLCVILVTAAIYCVCLPDHSISVSVMESVAGWTTTGVAGPDPLGSFRSLVLWRTASGWLGAIGTFTILTALIRGWQVSSSGTALAEMAGPEMVKKNPVFSGGYRKILVIYVLLTAVAFVLLRTAGMSFYDSALTALSSVSTAGLRHLGSGVLSLTAAEVTIITVMAFAGSAGIVVWLMIRRGKFSAVLRNSEMRFYLGRIIVTFALISAMLFAAAPDSFTAGRDGAILAQTISFFSTSGHVIADCSSWPEICIMVVMLQMFIGACSVSTGGGIKNVRAVVALKSVSATIYRHIHPSSVRSMTLDKEPVKDEDVMSAELYAGLFMLTYLTGAVLLSAGGMSLGDSLGWSQAMITNTGTSVTDMTGTALAGGLSPYTRLVMSILMLAGRLEIYPLLMIFLHQDQTRQAGTSDRRSRQ